MSITSPRLSCLVTVILLSAVSGIACKKSEPSGAAAATTAPATTAAVPSAAAAAANQPAGGGPGLLGKGVIKGNARFTGKAPEAKAISTPDPFCARQALREEDLIVGPGGGLKNLLVRVVRGASGTYAPPATDAVLDQSGCVYRPRVQAVIAGQPVQIKNSDQTLHNVHTYKGASTLFNQAQIPGMGPMTKTFSDGGQMIKFKCDVHPWMTGYVAVATNPFFAVSGADGAFTIDKLPAGTYTIEAWHERLGTKQVDVTVTEGQPATAAFEYAGP